MTRNNSVIPLYQRCHAGRSIHALGLIKNWWFVRTSQISLLINANKMPLWEVGWCNCKVAHASCSQESTDNLKLISIHSKRFEVRRLSTKCNSQLTNYQLTNVKLKQCLGCSFGGGKMDRHCFRAIKIGLDQFHKYIILLSIAELPTDWNYCRS